MTQQYAADPTTCFSLQKRLNTTKDPRTPLQPLTEFLTPQEKAQHLSATFNNSTEPSASLQSPQQSTTYTMSLCNPSSFFSTTSLPAEPHPLSYMHRPCASDFQFYPFFRNMDSPPSSHVPRFPHVSHPRFSTFSAILPP